MTVQGWLSVVHGDPQHSGTSSAGLRPRTLYFLDDDQGARIQLQLGDPLPLPIDQLVALLGRRVRARGRWRQQTTTTAAGSPQKALSLLSVAADAPGGGGPLGTTSATAAAVSGTSAWVSVLCKFGDAPAEQRPLSYFQDMYRNSKPGLDHYWRELSRDLVNTAGSQAVGWYTLPHPRAHYIVDGRLDFDAAATDCTAPADATVNFADFDGINLMFNDDLDGYAWGGGWCGELDGEYRCWSMTWEPPWGWQNIGVMQHEMGHGFGLPHSSGEYGRVYDNQWDVMSDHWTNCSRTADPVYGCVGQHTIAYHKDLLGWIPADRRFVAPLGATSTVTLEQSALPGASGQLLAEVLLGDAPEHFLTLEARRQVGYDQQLPGQGVIIHEVLTTRPIPARVKDVDGDGDTGDDGARFTVGETFSMPAADNKMLKVEVKAATASGWTVEIRYDEAFNVYLPLVVR